MNYLGIDIASQNPGYVVLEGRNNIIFSRTWVTPDSFKVSDVKRAEFQLSVLKKIIGAVQCDIVVIEAPAMSFKNQMVSIGFIHGAITSFINSLGVTWLYVPPTKHKYAFLKNGRADKAIGLSFVKRNFTFASRVDIEHFDHNQADAAMLAHLAYLFDCYAQGVVPEYLEDTENRMLEIFFDKGSTGKKPSGICFRRNSFYFNSDLTWE